MPTYTNTKMTSSERPNPRLDVEDCHALFLSESLEIKAPSFTVNGFASFCKALSQSYLKQFCVQKLFLSKEEWATLIEALNNNHLEELDISYGNIPVELIPTLIAKVPTLRILKGYNLSAEKERHTLEKALLAHENLEECRGFSLSESTNKHLHINKEFNSVKALLAKLNNAAQRGQLSYTLLNLIKNEIYKHLMSIRQSKLSPARYDDLLHEVQFTLGDNYNQFGDVKEAEKHLTRVLAYSKTTSFALQARTLLANLYYAKGIDPTIDLLERLAYLKKAAALNEPNLVDYTQKTLLSTCHEALAACEQTALVLSQEITEVEQKLITSPTEFQETAKRFPEPPREPKKLLSACRLPSSPKF